MFFKWLIWWSNTICRELGSCKGWWFLLEKNVDPYSTDRLIHWKYFKRVRLSLVTGDLFAQYLLIKLALPEAAQLSLVLIGKSVALHLLEEPELMTHYWEDGEEKKAQDLAGFEPMTSLLQGVRSTAVLHPLPGVLRYFMSSFQLLKMYCKFKMVYLYSIDQC